MGEPVARVRVDRAQCRLADREVIRVRCRDPLPVALRRLGEHPLWSNPADLPGDVPAQLMRDVHPAVRVAEEGHVGDPERLGRGPLLGLPQRRNLLAGGLVEAARVAQGGDAVRHLDPGVGPRRNRRRRTEVHVVGVRGYHQDAVDAGGGFGAGSGHGIRSYRPVACPARR